jgi:flagellar biosynthesis regulator FlbT
MRHILMIIIPLVIFLSFTIWINDIMAKEADELIKALEKIESAVKDENWQSALKAIREADDKWSPLRKKWKSLIDHFEVDKIDSEMVRIEEWIKLKNKKDCLADLAVLKQNIAHIPEKEKIRLSNIF